MIGMSWWQLVRQVVRQTGAPRKAREAAMPGTRGPLEVRELEERFRPAVFAPWPARRAAPKEEMAALAPDRVQAAVNAVATWLPHLAAPVDVAALDRIMAAQAMPADPIGLPPVPSESAVRQPLAPAADTVTYRHDGAHAPRLAAHLSYSSV